MSQNLGPCHARTARRSKFPHFRRCPVVPEDGVVGLCMCCGNIDVARRDEACDVSEIDDEGDSALGRVANESIV